MGREDLTQRARQRVLRPLRGRVAALPDERRGVHGDAGDPVADGGRPRPGCADARLRRVAARRGPRRRAPRSSEAAATSETMIVDTCAPWTVSIRCFVASEMTAFVARRQSPRRRRPAAKDGALFLRREIAMVRRNRIRARRADYAGRESIRHDVLQATERYGKVRDDAASQVRADLKTPVARDSCRRSRS